MLFVLQNSVSKNSSSHFTYFHPLLYQIFWGVELENRFEEKPKLFSKSSSLGLILCQIQLLSNSYTIYPTHVNKILLDLITNYKYLYKYPGKAKPVVQITFFHRRIFTPQMQRDSHWAYVTNFPCMAKCVYIPSIAKYKAHTIISILLS